MNAEDAKLDYLRLILWSNGIDMRNIPSNTDLVGSEIIRPVFYEVTLTGECYLEFLRTIVVIFFS